jgi:glutamate--cysteine ligase
VSLTEAKLLNDVRQRLFSPVTPRAPRAVGVELELIPVIASTRRPALPRKEETGARSTAEIISRLAKRERWLEQSAEEDPPSWKLSDGTGISFEPGGQIEISSAPQATASSVIDSTRKLVAILRDAMMTEGIELLARGVDPYNSIDAVPLQLHRDRYARMTRYFDSIGPSGVRMMRQTAAVQINVERGDDPLSRWRLLNGLAPIVVALFANSRDYAGKSTEWATYRAHLWRTLDPSRTGIISEEPCAKSYLEFALDAVAMRSGDERVGGYRMFREWMREPGVDEGEWLFHLSTLFPEVRPKEYFELRSADTIEPDMLAAPVVFVTGLIYEAQNAARATEILGVPSPDVETHGARDADLMERAGRSGLRDAEISTTAAALCELAMEGAERLGVGYISKHHREEAWAYFESKKQTSKSG